jgi:pyrroloquinoline-quinone synthase
MTMANETTIARAELLSGTELTTRLRAVLEEGYHHLHPFNLAMHRGELTREQLSMWVANRFCYQQHIPVKDALLLSKLPLEYRRVWISRIHTHDGSRDGEGGLEKWLVLGEAVGLQREELLDGRHVLPGVQFVVDAYVNFIRDHSWLEGVASSLTEMFAPLIMIDRTTAFEDHYDWVAPVGLQYFRSRVQQAPEEAKHALEVVLQHARTPEKQQQMIAALRFKCSMLWALLDAVMVRYPLVGQPASSVSTLPLSGQVERA